MPFDHPGVLTISEEVTRVSGRDPVVETALRLRRQLLVPTRSSLIFGIGDPSWGTHGTNEFLPVDDLIEATKIFAGVTMAWCGVTESA